MRQAMRTVFDTIENNDGQNGIPDHVGLAYDVWARTETTGKERGKIAGDKRTEWLKKLEEISLPDGYETAFKRWEDSFAPADLLGDLVLDTRLLVGHGNPSPTEVGLTVHHTWGVPVIPGSALKGLLAHYVETTIGPDDPSVLPWNQPDEKQKELARFQGVTWKKNRIERSPGDVYRALFGAPDAQNDALYLQHGVSKKEVGACKGGVVFHDALYVPGTPTRNDVPNLPVIAEGKPFAVDVLTVHQSEYYKAANKPAQPWPCDYDDPTPVGFLSVGPGTKFLLALSGEKDYVALASQLLSLALSEWGIGGKTAAGYGRGEVTWHSQHQYDE